MYGVTKVAGELLCDYYHQRFDVDTRGVRWTRRRPARPVRLRAQPQEVAEVTGADRRLI